MVYYNVSGYNSGMFLVGILSWWYGNGWVERLRIINDRLRVTTDRFSVFQLITTLFAPYRQIAAGRVEGSIEDKIRAFWDRSFSRLVGFVVRSAMIVIGSFVLLAQIIFGAVTLVFWLFIPLMPTMGLILMVLGWTPA